MKERRKKKIIPKKRWLFPLDWKAGSLPWSLEIFHAGVESIGYNFFLNFFEFCNFNLFAILGHKT
jgi:hypothetical protein